MKYDSKGQIKRVYELLCDEKPDEEKLADMSRAKGFFYRTKAIRSGDLLELECYPILTGKDSARARKQKASSVQQRHLNERNSEKRLIRLAETNFSTKDYFLTLTYEGEDSELPGLDEAIKGFDRFRRRVNRLRKKFGLEGNCRCLYVVEGKTDGDRKTRVHIHALIDGDLPRDVIEDTWKHGFANAKRIQRGQNGSVSALAKYMSKQTRGKDERHWNGTRNLKKPKETTADRKISAHRAWEIAANPDEAKKTLETKLYPGYELEGEIFARDNTYLPGCYLYIKMRKKK